MNNNLNSDSSQHTKTKFSIWKVLLLLLGFGVLIAIDFIICFVSGLNFFCKGELTGCTSQGPTYLFFIILVLGIYALYLLFRPKKEI